MFLLGLKLYQSHSFSPHSVFEEAVCSLSLCTDLYSLPMTFSPEPVSFVPRSVHILVNSKATLLAKLILALVVVARTPCILPLSMVFPISEIAFIGMSGRSEDTVAVKLAIKKLTFKFVTIIEDDASMTIFEVIVELAFVDVLANLLQTSIAFEAMIAELSFIHFFPVCRYVFSGDQLIFFENSSIDRSILLVDALPTGTIIFPSPLIETALRPYHAPLAMPGCIFGLSLIYFSSAVLDPEFIVGERQYLGPCLFAVLFASGNIDVDWRARVGIDCFIVWFLLKGFALLANLCVSHQKQQKWHGKINLE